jgi:cardiolipin synthase
VTTRRTPRLGVPTEPERLLSPRRLAEQAFSRAAGAPLIPGNDVRVLRDATENYPAWLEAIAGARKSIFFESYIFANDRVGRQFAEALAERARAGVEVRVLYDWLGTWGSGRLWQLLRRAGAEVRGFNPPHIDSPLGWVSRDHRKMIAIDGEQGFVTGLCVSARWQGRPERGVPEWRDTGLAIRGPAVAEVEEAFAQTWAAAGDPLPAGRLTPADTIPAAGDVAVRVIASTPNTAGLFRLDQLIAALARQRLWLTDAYFVGTTPYVQALCAAARDGVDVRLLVPGASDIAVLSPLSRAGYRPLLEAGVRVYEWNGSMLHAKSAVADNRWSRVGSTNLNIASWLANYELDVAIEDERVAAEMAEDYEDDLEHATEIVLAPRNRVRPAARRRRRHLGWRPRAGSAGRAAAGVMRIGSTVGAAITDHRVLGAAEARVLAVAALALLAIAVVGVLWPPVVAVPAAGLAAWLGIAVLLRSWRLYRRARKSRGAETPRITTETPPPRRTEDRVAG